MKRRRFVQSLVVAPAASVLLAQKTPPPPGNAGNSAPGVPQNPAVGTQPPGSASRDLTHTDASVPDVAAETMQRFFSPAQFEALRHLCDLLQPAADGHPGAVDASAPAFLDFLISESPEDRQQLYRNGLDALNAAAEKRYHKPFGGTTAEEAGPLLAALNQPWHYNPPADPLGHFLIQAKADIRTATINSREYATSVPAGASAGRRRFGGAGLYWHSLD